MVMEGSSKRRGSGLGLTGARPNFLRAEGRGLGMESSLERVWMRS